MPSREQHLEKYINSKKILNSLNVQDKSQCDWIATIAFYSALHIIERDFANQNKHFRTHMERETFINENEKYRKNKIALKYKQLSSNSKVARYGPGVITPTQANQMLLYLRDIENEFTVKS